MWRPYGALLVLTALLGFALFRPWVHGIDGTGYYSWLRSTVIDHDLETADEFQHFASLSSESDWHDPFRATATGLHANPYPIGAAILWLPAFLLAHLLAPLLGYPADGYSPPYIWAISLSSVAWGLASLVLLLDIARRWATRAPAWWGIVAVWLGSPLIFYQYAHPSMSHAADVLVNTLVVWWWCRPAVRSGRTGAWFVLGALIGGAALVRVQNGVLLLLPAGWLLVFTQRDQGWRQALRNGALLATGVVLLLTPQLLVWWRVFGSPFVNVQAIAYRAPLGFDLLHPHLLDVLFSSNRGLFTWSPILLPATLAWPALWRRDRRLAAFVLANAVTQIYLVAAWTTWWGGAAFGARLLLGIFPFWALSLAAGCAWLVQRGWPVLVLAGATGAFAAWNGLLLMQYALGTVARNGPTDLHAMVRNQWGLVAHLLTRLAVH